MRFLVSIVATAFVLSFSGPVHAQDIVFSSKYEVELGKPYPVIDGVKRYFEAGEAVICIKNDGRRWFLQKLSANGLSQTSMQQYEDLPSDMAIEYIGYFGKRLLMFYSLWDKPNEKEQLFYREVDIEAGKFIGKGTRLLAVKGKVSGTMVGSGFYRFHVTDKFDFIFSADDEHLVIQYLRKRDKHDESTVYRISVAVFNSALDEEWTAELRMPYDADKMTIRDYTIDSKGDICIIANVYKGSEEKAKNREDADWHYEFLRCTGQGAAWEKTPSELSGRVLMSVQLFEDRTGTLRAAGFYKKERKQNGADGIFVCGFDANDELSAVAFHEIPRELIMQLMSKRELKKKAKEEAKGEDLGFTDMDLNRVIVADDGSMLVVGEKRFTTTVCYTDSRGYTRCQTYWHANEMLITSLDPNGELEWMKLVSKSMVSSFPISTSFKYLYGGGAHHFLHFEVKDKHNMVIAERLEESDGTHTEEVVLDTEELKNVKLYQLDLDRMVRTADGEVLMEAYKKNKEDVLVRIAVKQ